MKPFELLKAESIDAALKSANATNSYISGGTNLVDLMKKQIDQPDGLIDLSHTLSNNIENTNNGVYLGAMTTNTAIAEHKTIKKDFPLISKAILAGASPQIRNMATAGGNLLQRTRCPYFYDTVMPCNKRKPNSGCGALNGHQRMAAIIGYSNSCVAVHPSDFCIALIALDADVDIVTQNGLQKTIAFQEFHRLPENNPVKDNNLPANAIITGIIIPNNKFGDSVSYVKIRERDSYAFALVSVAAALEIKNGKIKEARLASGGVAHKPWRWHQAENFLKDKEATQENFIKTADLIASHTKPLQHNTFKVSLLKGAIETALMECLTNSKRS